MRGTVCRQKKGEISTRELSWAAAEAAEEAEQALD